MDGNVDMSIWWKVLPFKKKRALFIGNNSWSQPIAIPLDASEGFDN